MRDYRFQPKKQNFFLRRLKLFAFAFVLVSITVLGAYGLGELNLLKVKNLDIRGSEAVGNETLLSELKPIIIGRNILTKALGEDNILVWGNQDFSGLYNKFPRLANISISRDLFRGEVSIEVTGKEKLAIWCIMVYETCYWIDNHGEIFDSAPLVKGRIVKVIHDYSPNRLLKIGDKALKEEEINNLNKIFGLLSTFGFSTKEIKIEDIKYKEISVYLEDGPELQFGLNIDPTFSQSVIKSLRDSSEWPKIRYIDLRIQNRVYYSR